MSFEDTSRALIEMVYEDAFPIKFLAAVLARVRPILLLSIRITKRDKNLLLTLI